MSTREHSEQFVESARQVYAENREALENEHLGKIIGIEPESGDFVFGENFLDVDQKSQERFGTKPVYFTRVGGGGAMRIRGGRVA